MSSYLEFNDRRVVVDLGKSDDFNPVEDFLLPLAKIRKFTKNVFDGNKYEITQAFLSHQDNDHISSIIDFDKYFHPLYLTAPTSHPKQNKIFNIILKYILKPGGKNEYSEHLIKMMELRKPGHGKENPNNPKEPLDEDKNKPLVVYPDCADNIELFHIPADVCGSVDFKKSYSNNTSLVLFFNINSHTVLMPGDIMKEGIEYLLNNEADLYANIRTLGVDFLVVPHHGLSSSFSETLFQSMKNKKTNRLNIISEKRRKSDSDEQRSDVDSRYYSEDYSSGNNNLDGQRGRKTSEGHIVIDYSGIKPFVKIIKTEDKEALVNEFI